MQKVQFVWVTDCEIVDGKLPDLRGRQVLELMVLPPTSPGNGPSFEFAGGSCQVMLPPHRYFSHVPADVEWLEGKPFDAVRTTLTHTRSEFVFVPIAVSDDDGTTWRLLPQHPDYVALTPADT